MILKFTFNSRIDRDTNISVASEQVVDTEEEAEEAGAEFFKMMNAFIRGYGSANEEDQS